MGKNQLEIMVSESKLQPSKAEYLLEQFRGCFEIAAQWEAKAKTIVVTNPDQTEIMEKAREGRLILKDARIALEKSRKSMKEESLREGKSIDGIANVLKALIVPIENWLDKQEHFVERAEEAKREAKRQEIEKRMADEEAAEAKARAEEEVKLRAENERLKKEAAEKERKDAIERKKRETRLASERGKATAEREVIEKKLRMERAKAEDERARERYKVEADKRKVEEKAKKEKEAREWELSKERAIAREKEEAERKEKERLAELLKNQITCPACQHKFQLEEGKR